jgi:hypothetical protein
MQHCWIIRLSFPRQKLNLKLKLISTTLLLSSLQLSLNAQSHNISLQPQLQEQILTPTPWISLGIVADSEKKSSITPRGEELRKALQHLIQMNGGENLPLALSTRMKLERMWSIPFTGQFSKELKAKAKEHKSNLISGSYSPSSPKSLQVLTYIYEADRTYIYHCTTSDTNTKPLPNLPTPQTQKLPLQRPIETQNQQTKIESATPTLPQSIWEFESFEPSRQRPDEQTRRRYRNPRAVGIRKSNLQQHLDNNDILKKYQDTQIHKSQRELITLRNDLIERSQNSFMTSSKIELLSRAYTINGIITPEDLNIKEKIVERLLAHEEFFSERRN